MLRDGDQMPGARWFPDARLNFAENLLRRRDDAPARVIQVSDIPRTRSGKIVELAVRDVVHGRAVENREALANPEALDLFASLPELES